MKFILINPDYMLYSAPPLALAYLAGYLKKNLSGLDITILDQLRDEDIIKKVIELKPEVIGFTAVSANYIYVKELAEKIKKLLPNAIIIIGGVHITSSPESFKSSPFDFAVIGEGETIALRFFKSLIKNKSINIKDMVKIKGLLIRQGKKTIYAGESEFISNLDDIPIPDRDMLNMKYYLLPRFSSKDNIIDSLGCFLTSRGCPYACKFCGSSLFWKRRIRFFSAERVIEEIEILYNKYGYGYLIILDDLFSINKPRLRKIIDGLKQKNILGKIKFYVSARANCFDEEIASLLKEMNVISIFFGFETGSQKMLSYLKGPGITLEHGINSINLAKKYNLNPGGFFMIGSPGETKKDLDETYHFIKNYCRDNFMLYQTRAFPGTEIWDYAIKNKIIAPDFYEHEQKEFSDMDPEILLSKNVSQEDFINYFQKIKSLATKKKVYFLRRLIQIRPKHLRAMMSKEFRSKVKRLYKSYWKKSL